VGRKYKFRFAPKFSKHLHQPVISMGIGCVRSLVIYLNEGLGVKTLAAAGKGSGPTLGDFGRFITKIIHFRHVSTKLLRKNLSTCSLLCVSVLKCSILSIILFKY